MISTNFCSIFVICCLGNYLFQLNTHFSFELFEGWLNNFQIIRLKQFGVQISSSYIIILLNPIPKSEIQPQIHNGTDKHIKKQFLMRFPLSNSFLHKANQSFTFNIILQEIVINPIRRQPYKLRPCN